MTARILWLALATGCGPAPTEIVLVVDTDLTGADELRASATAPDGSLHQARADLATQPPPRTLVLRHGGSGMLGPLQLRLAALEAGAPLVEVERELSFVPQRRLRLRVMLPQACRGVDCGSETCGDDGRCRPIAVGPCELDGCDADL